MQFNFFNLMRYIEFSFRFIKQTMSIFLLLNCDKIKRKINDNTKKIVGSFIEKNSSIENDRISPVRPNDIISIKFNLSTDDHQLLRYFIIYNMFFN